MITRKAFFKSIGLTLASIPLVGFFKKSYGYALPNVVEASRSSGVITQFCQDPVLTIILTDQILLKFEDGTFDLNKYGNMYQFIATAIIPCGPKIGDAKYHRFESTQFSLDNTLNKVSIKEIERSFRKQCLEHIKNPENIKQMNKINSFPNKTTFEV